MQIIDTHSVRDAKLLLRHREALEPCHKVARRYDGMSKETGKLLRDLGFEPQWPFDAGGNHPRLDAYHHEWKVGIERERGEQMNARSHLLFTEIGFRKGLIEVGVFILPIKGQATFGRTVREVTEYEIFTEYFPLRVPLYLIGCE